LHWELSVEIIISKADLSQYDTGGGTRETTTHIEVDETDSPRQQRRTVIYEVLGALLDPFEAKGEDMECLTDKIMDALDQLESK
jgi:hypothetical protein